MIAAQAVSNQTVSVETAPAHAVLAQETAGQEVTAQEVTVREAARLSRRSPETVRRWIWSGRLPARKVGNSYRVDLVHLVRVAAVDQSSAAQALPGSGRLAAWLDGTDRWKRELSAGQRPTAADLVLEHRYACR